MPDALLFLIWVAGILLAVAGSVVITILIVAAIRVLNDNKEDKL